MATLTITTTAQQDARIAEAFGHYVALTDAQGNPRSATLAEVKAAIIEDIRVKVEAYELRRDRAALKPVALNIAG